MGQYYKPVCLDTMEFVYSHTYNNGLKLMEHSYIGNNFVAVVEHLIAKGGAWFGKRIVWAGDYAAPEPNGIIDEETKEAPNLYMLVEENEIQPVIPETRPNYRYLVNLDTNEFVDFEKIPPTYIDKETGDKWYIHPLPLLTCEGNGQGGGDYFGKDRKKIIGKWARNRVTIQEEKPEGMTELLFDLTEL